MDAIEARSLRPPFAWRLAVGLVTGLLVRVFRWKVISQMPATPLAADRPLLVVINHTSNIDAFVVADTLWRRLHRWVRPLGKAEAFKIPVVGTVGRAAGAIPVARESDTSRGQAYDAAAAAMAGGDAILIAPEGTITHDGELLPLRHGAARLALQTGAQVLVVTHLGAQRAFSPVTVVPHRRAVMTMVMDVLVPWEGEDETALTGRIAATLMDRMGELLATHPQADPAADWWPPYAAPSVPTATASDNISRYRTGMHEAVAHARERMARLRDHGHEHDEPTGEPDPDAD